MGLTSIPVSAIWRYCERLEMTEVEADVFETVIRLIDAHFVSKRAAAQAESVK